MPTEPWKSLLTFEFLYTDQPITKITSMSLCQPGVDLRLLKQHVKQYARAAPVGHDDVVNTSPMEVPEIVVRPKAITSITFPIDVDVSIIAEWFYNGILVTLENLGIR